MYLLKNGSIKTHHKLWCSFLILATALVGTPFAGATGVTQTNQKGQNKLTYSQDLAATGWADDGVGTTRTSNFAQAPNGTMTASRVVFPSGSHYIYNFAGGAGIPFVVGPATISVWARGTSGTAKFRFRLQSSLAVTNVTSPDITLGTTWQRVSFSTFVDTKGAGFMNAAFFISDAGNDAADFLLWGFQIEQASKPGAYNPTTSAAINSSFFPTGATKSNQLGQNMLKFSEQFNNATGWTLSNITVSADTATSTAPNGTRTADLLVDSVDGGATSHLVVAVNTVGTVGNVYTLSVYAKATGGQWLALAPDSGASGFITYFDLVNGVLGTNGGSTIARKIQSVGNGWYRCSVTFRTTAPNVHRIYMAGGNGTLTYTGAGTSRMIFWGAQVVQGTGPAAYVSTAATAVNSTFISKGATKSNQLGQNLLTFSEQFDDAAWPKTSLTVGANSSTAPNGTMTAEKFTDSNDGGATQHYVSQSIVEVVGRKYTASFYAKAGTKSAVGIAPDAASFAAAFDLTNGTVGPWLNVTGISKNIYPVGNGWYRCSVTYISNVASAVERFYTASSSASVVYQGDGTGTVFIWGVQIVQGTKPAAYVKTTSAAVNPNYQP